MLLLEGQLPGVGLLGLLLLDVRKRRRLRLAAATLLVWVLIRIRILARIRIWIRIRIRIRVRADAGARALGLALGGIRRLIGARNGAAAVQRHLAEQAAGAGGDQVVGWCRLCQLLCLLDNGRGRNTGVAQRFRFGTTGDEAAGQAGRCYVRRA